MASQINASNSGFGGIVSTGDSSGELQLQTAGTTAVTINTSQRAAFVAGTAAAPAITTTGDTNTGMFFPAADTIAFAEGGTEAMRLDASGNVGIGTTSPVTSYRLSIYDQTNGATNISGLALIEPGSATSYSYFKTTSQASADTRTIIGNGAASRAFAFETGGTERMRIDSSGNLLVNTTSASGSSNTFKSTAGAGAQALSIWNNATSGTRYFLSFATETSSTDRGYITYNGTTVAISQASDERLKENINDAPSALEKINDIKIRSFDWKEDNRHIDYGVIAQELIKIVPSAVFEGVDNEDGSINKYWSVGLEPLIPILTKAIQEQQTIINDLKARVEILEAK